MRFLNRVQEGFLKYVKDLRYMLLRYYLSLIFFLMSPVLQALPINAPIIKSLKVVQEEQGNQGVTQNIVKALVLNEPEDIEYTYQVVSGNASLEPLEKSAILNIQSRGPLEIQLVISNGQEIYDSKSIKYIDEALSADNLYKDRASWQQATGRLSKHPSFAFQQNNDKLPNVLIIGDSISIGYTPYVQTSLAGKFNVYRIPENGGDTGRGLQKLDYWLSSLNWEVIHFNFGLHDLKRLTNNTLDISGQIVNPPEIYAENLKEIVKKLRKKTAARLIWASITAVPAGAVGRMSGDEILYNKLASQVMKENKIVINDLYKLSTTYPEGQLPADVHFSDIGKKQQANQVVEYILIKDNHSH